MSYKGLNFPLNGEKLTNPLKNGEKIKRLKKQHTETLAKSGLHPPRSPLR